MSRSRKFPMFKLKNSRFSKQQSNKKIRKFKKIIANGRAFKKVFPSWDICDYKSYPIVYETRWTSVDSMIELIEKTKRK